MELFGSNNLTNSELLSIIIKTGTKELSCLQIARNILMSNKKLSYMNELEYLDSLSLQELQKFEGIGKVKAIQIKATLELAKRFQKENLLLDKFKIISPKDVFSLVAYSYNGLKNEVIKVIILNKQNKVLSVFDAASGGIDKVEIDIKQILSEPIKQLASSIILTHNHPGGSLKASSQDITFTKKIQEYCKIFDINLLDHIIIADNNYISMKELNVI